MIAPWVGGQPDHPHRLFVLLAPGGRNGIQEYVFGLEQQALTKTVAFFERVTKNGPPVQNPEHCLKMPDTDFWEFKPTKPDRYFWKYVKGEMVLFHAFRKTSNQTPKHQVDNGRNLSKSVDDAEEGFVS